MKGLLGKKIGMTQVFQEDGVCVPITVIEAGPCKITQIKTPEKDKYSSLQLAFDPVKKGNRVPIPQQGHFSPAGILGAKYVKEFRTKDTFGFEVGQEIKADIFKAGEKVKVIGTSKGKGFQGTVKRHNFTRGPVSHGSHNIRQPGSIGQSSDPSRVFKNLRMAGHMGN